MCENRCNFVLIFLGDKRIETGLGFEQRDIKRHLRTVVWMQMEVDVAARRYHMWRIERKSKATKSLRKKRCGRTLTATDKKLATAHIDGGLINRGLINRMPRLLPPSQRAAPRMVTCGTEI